MDNFEAVHFIDSSLAMDSLRQETLKDATDLQSFMTAHCHSSHYTSSRLKSVANKYVPTVQSYYRLPQEQFERFHFIPPTSSSQSCQRTLQEVCGALWSGSI